jgi:tRNA modification GTPase
MTAARLACLTPPGTAAIATLALRGPAAWTLVRELAQHLLPADPAPGRFWLTRIGDKQRGEVDDVVVAVKQVRPEPSVELHCHGGREVIRFLEELLIARGVQVCTWQELESQAGDMLRTLALDTLTKALTARTASIALDQLDGAFASALQSVQSALQAGQAAHAESQLREMERYAALGRHLTVPWRVVIAGPVNVGKSSLANALAGYQRSIVAPTPGTTRDLVTTLLAVQGWPIELADTAGWRSTGEAIEREGINLARQAASSADLCLWLLDASTAPVRPDANLGRVQLVVNKVDLPAVWSAEEIAAPRISALQGTGIAELCDAVAKWLVPDIPPPGAAVPFTPALADAVSAAHAEVKAGNLAQAAMTLAKAAGECD